MCSHSLIKHPFMTKKLVFYFYFLLDPPMDNSLCVFCCFNCHAILGDSTSCLSSQEDCIILTSTKIDNSKQTTKIIEFKKQIVMDYKEVVNYLMQPVE